MALQPERPPETAMQLEIIQVLEDESEYEVAARRIEEIERRYVAAADEEERLALQQSAARWTFIAAADTGTLFKEVAARFHRICEIGFSGPHSELAVLVEFADVCNSFGHWEEGLRVLARARERLPDWGFKLQSKVVDLLDRCQRRLESGETD
jgi:hypothetical protein